MALSVQTQKAKNDQTVTFSFPSKVNAASVAIQGFEVDYSSTDHHVQGINVQATLNSVSGSTVSATAECTMKDHSNNIADGIVTIVCIAEIQ